MDSQQPENPWLHLLCLRWIDDYHPSMGNPADMTTSHKLTTTQGEQKINKSVAQVYSTCSPRSKQNQPKIPTPWPGPVLRAAGLGLVLTTRGCCLQQRMVAPGKFKRRSHIRLFPGTRHKGIQTLSQGVLFPTERRNAAATVFL